MTGRDADEDIETFSIEFFDGEGVSVFEGAIDQPAELDEPFGTFYVDGDYTYSTEFLWTQPLLYGVADAEVTVTDSARQHRRALRLHVPPDRRARGDL